MTILGIDSTYEIQLKFLDYGIVNLIKLNMFSNMNFVLVVQIIFQIIGNFLFVQLFKIILFFSKTDSDWYYHIKIKRKF